MEKQRKERGVGGGGIVVGPTCPLQPDESVLNNDDVQSMSSTHWSGH